MIHIRSDMPYNKALNSIRCRNYRSTVEGKAAVARTMRKYRQANRQKAYARTCVRNALRTGKLIKTCCLFCLSPHVEAHHSNYSLPLAVIWVCKKHHQWLDQQPK